MTNIAELLKDAPKGMKLYSPLFGELELKCANLSIGGYPIAVIAKNGDSLLFDKYGRYFDKDRFPDAECLLFPSKDYRTWQGWTPYVKPKFKVGDWLYPNYNGIYPVLVTDYNKYCGYQLQEGSDRCHLSTKIIENEYHPWTIADAKDGDVLFSKAGCPFIFREDIVHADRHNIMAYCGIDTTGTFIKSSNKTCWTYDLPKPATKEQRDLLFAKMKDAGYEWDAGKKELRKIKPNYDIDNFKPKQWVLVRDDDEWEWVLTRFSYLSYGSASLFVCINGASFQQCIPFEGNETLLGTTDMCDEQYINW